MKKLSILITAIAFAFAANAQLNVVATNDTNFCNGGDVQITANASGGTTPYVFNWLPATGLGCTNCQSPLANPAVKTTYTVTVRDLNSNISIDSVTVNPIDFYMYFTNDRDTVCLGSSVQLNISLDPTKCGANKGGCSGATTTHVLGTGTDASTGYSFPSPFGSYYYGAKSQYLYRAQDLQGIGMDKGTISEVSFYITNFNVFSQMRLYTIKMKCTNLSGITAFQPNTETVFGPTTLNKSDLQIGWNTIMLDNHFDWDGESSIILEICYYNGVYTPNANCSSYYTTTTYDASIEYRVFTNTICSYIGTRFPSKFLPNTRFTLCKQTPLGLDFVWNPTAGLSDPSIHNPLASPTTTTSYILSVNNNGCLKKDTAVIVVKPKATADFTYSVVGRDAFFTDKSTGGNSIKWLFGDGASSTAKYPIHYYTVGGMYDVSLIIGNSFDCPDTAIQKVDMTHIGLNDNENNLSTLKVFPNPFQEELEIIYSLNNQTEISVEVYNILGEHVYTIFRGTQNAGQQKLSFSSKEAGLTSGIYVLRLTTGSGESYSTRLVDLN